MAKDANTKALGKILHGQGKSTRVIANECNVTQKTAMAWAKEWTEAGFPKGFAEAKVAQAAEKAMQKEREKQGLTRARVEAKVAALMDAKKNIYFKGDFVAEEEDNGTQLGATSLAADILGMKKDPLADAMENGVFAFYRDQLKAKRGKK